MASTGKNYHIIEAIYQGASNFRGARVKIYSARFHKTRYTTYDYQKRDALEMVVDYLVNDGFKIIGHGEAKKGYYIITSTFKSI